jgi:ribosomal protein S18 acetylase RimI-like enzyme
MKSEGQNISVRRASRGDLDLVCAVMSDAARWLQSRGIKQWGWVLTDRGREYILKRIESAETYLVFRDSQSDPIATFTVQWEDSATWGERGGDGMAGYVHGLAVCRCAAGKGLGVELISIASTMIHDRGRGVIRLDCRAESAALCDYYRSAGFVEQGIGGGDSGFPPVRLFERTLA